MSTKRKTLPSDSSSIAKVPKLESSLITLDIDATVAWRKYITLDSSTIAIWKDLFLPNREHVERIIEEHGKCDVWMGSYIWDKKYHVISRLK
jgi:hypothetical protein